MLSYYYLLKKLWLIKQNYNNYNNKQLAKVELLGIYRVNTKNLTKFNICICLKTSYILFL